MVWYTEREDAEPLPPRPPRPSRWRRQAHWEEPLPPPPPPPPLPLGLTHEDLADLIEAKFDRVLKELREIKESAQ